MNTVGLLRVVAGRQLGSSKPPSSAIAGIEQVAHLGDRAVPIVRRAREQPRDDQIERLREIRHEIARMRRLLRQAALDHLLTRRLVERAAAGEHLIKNAAEA